MVAVLFPIRNILTCSLLTGVRVPPRALTLVSERRWTSARVCAGLSGTECHENPQSETLTPNHHTLNLKA